MRVPLRHSYRAWPQFDAFDDAACRRIKRRAHRAAAARVGWSILGFAAVAVFTFILMAPLLAAVIAEADNSLRSAGRSYPSLFLWFVILHLFGMIPGVLLLCLADVSARRRLLNELDRTTCVGCGYPLTGLPAVADAIRCSECGEVLPLSDVSPETREQLLGRRCPVQNPLPLPLPPPRPPRCPRRRLD